MAVVTSAPDHGFRNALNDLLPLVRWADDGRIRNLNNNVHLAAEISRRRPRAVSQSYIQALRYGTSIDPRWSVVCDICDICSAKTGVRITPNYFSDPAERVQVDEQLFERLRALEASLEAV